VSDQMQTCPYCGAPSRLFTNLCPSCGRRLSSVKTENRLLRLLHALRRPPSGGDALGRDPAGTLEIYKHVPINRGGGEGGGRGV
jgi:hypothetical protein